MNNLKCSRDREREIETRLIIILKQRERNIFRDISLNIAKNSLEAFIAAVPT